MKSSSRFILDLVESAAFLHERTAGTFLPAKVQDEDELDHLMATWRQVVADGHEELFERRLSLDNLDVDGARRMLGRVCIGDEDTLPSWSETLRKVLAHEAWTDGITSPARLDARFLVPGESLPFEEALVPLVVAGREELLREAGSTYELLDDAAHAVLENNLLRSLNYLCAKALYLEFSEYCLSRQSDLARVLAEIAATGESRLYRSYIVGMLGDGRFDFFRSYPVIGRLVGVCIKFWLEGMCRFLKELQEDLPLISELFCRGQAAGCVVDVEPGLSDRHDSGRQVMTVTFASGLKLVYKPKDLSAEETYFELLSWLNDHGSPLDFKTLKVVNRKTRGWMEYVEHRACESEEEGEIYYRRAGQLLCLLYVLGCSDCHYENIVASGSYPVVVDLETLMQPGLSSFEDEPREASVRTLANEQFWKSVLRTGLLPRWQLRHDKQVYDISGLGSFSDLDQRYEKLVWKNMKTDGIALETVSTRVEEKSNVPFVDGRSLLPIHYQDEIIQGFRDMYEFILGQRDELLGVDSPLHALDGKPFRFILRNTAIYSRVLHRTIEPSLLRDARLWSMEIDVLSKPLLRPDSEGETLWPLVRSEICSLEQLDVPYFKGRSDKAELGADGGVTVDGFFRESGYEQVLSCLRGLDHDDMEMQTTFIRASLGTRYFDASHEGERSGDDDEEDAGSLEPERAVGWARSLAAELAEHAITIEGEGTTWIGNRYIPEAERLQVEPMRYGLYDGVCGVALFLAALESVDGSGRFSDLCLSALKPLCRELEDAESEPRLVTQAGIGGASGLGSVVYVFSCVSQFLNKPELVDHARRAASLISAEAIESDRYYDVIGGSAGAILGLLKLHDLTGDHRILQTAVECGDHLVRRRRQSPVGLNAWETSGDTLMGGFSHGVAGIAYALLRLHEATGATALLEAAEEAITYEDTLFSAERRNWRDLRSLPDLPESERYRTAWCHGAPGIGLGRIGGLRVLDTDAIRQDIDMAIATTVASPLKPYDHLCCGNFGVADVLLTAARRLNRPDLREEALSRAARLVARADRTGNFTCGMESQFNFGFFIGIAGIGYQLLRTMFPDKVHSVLLFE